MSKEMEFYIYLLEKYSEYKGVSTTYVINKLSKLNLEELVYGMYEKYHTESIINAFDDIDNLILEKENSF